MRQCCHDEVFAVVYMCFLWGGGTPLPAHYRGKVVSTGCGCGGNAACGRVGVGYAREL